MGSYYDVQSRVVECANCGAPLKSGGQTQIICQYCNAENALLPRPNDGRAAPSPSEEVARLARLKAQLEHPLAGHVYDLTAFPPTLAALGRAANIGADLDALWEVFPQVRAAAAEGIEQQRALVWVAISAARLLEHNGNPDVARAKLETALGHLPDPGHRLLVRAELALNALKLAERDAARAWLSECDPAPEVLELDSTLRYATARVRLDRGDPVGALTVIGAEPDAIPVARVLAVRMAVLRIDAYEKLDQLDKAQALWAKAQMTPPLATSRQRLLAEARAENLAPRTRLGTVEARVRRLRVEQVGARSWSWLLAGTLMRAPFWALLLALVTMVEGCTTKRGPLLGGIAYVACPVLCRECRPPLTYHFWSSSNGSSSSGHHAVFCDGKSAQPSSMEWTDLHRYDTAFPQLEVPGGALTLLGLSWFLLFPVALPLAFWRARAERRHRQSRLEATEVELGDLEAELRVAGRRIPAAADTLRRGWLMALGLCLFFATLFGAGVAASFAIFVEEPPVSASGN